MNFDCKSLRKTSHERFLGLSQHESLSLCLTSNYIGSVVCDKIAVCSSILTGGFILSDSIIRPRY